MAHGRIVERGTHDELVAAGGAYAALWAAWNGGACVCKVPFDRLRHA